MRLQHLARVLDHRLLHITEHVGRKDSEVHDGDEEIGVDDEEVGTEPFPRERLHTGAHEQPSR
jgi:hypothetical protein